MRLVVKRPTTRSAEHDSEWVKSQPLDWHLSWWGPRLVVKARRKVHPHQMGLFGDPTPADAAASKRQRKMFARQKPPGSGWQIIPGGKKGGYRRRKGTGWEYWYPDAPVKEKPQQPRLTVPRKEPEPEAVAEAPGEREAVKEAMAVRKTKGQRKAANELALEIVQRAARDQRGLTDEEAVKVAQYTGKGGISGDLNQFYTPVAVAEAMWRLTRTYTDKVPERVLEPSCGSGVFLQTAPAETTVTGVELDPQAAAISEALHGHKHGVEGMSFEEFTIANLGKPLDYDAVVANPPYCTRTGDIPLHKAEFKSADKYFIDTSIDHLKDGGVATLLIHPGVLNNKSPGWQEFRKRLLARCEIVDAFRLPKTTFKHVHCEIPADVLVLKKRDKRVGEALARAVDHDEAEPVLKHLGAWDEGFVTGDYFESRPERIIGQALSKEETGWRATVEGRVEDVPGTMRRLTDERKGKPAEGAATPITHEQLGELAKENETLKLHMEKAQAAVDAESIPPVIGETREIARSTYIYIGDPPRWKSIETVDDVSQIIENSGDEAVSEAHSLSKDIASLIAARDGGDYYKARAMRRKLAERVKAWVEEFGIPGSHRALGELSKSAPQLLDFMASVDSNGELSDVLSKDAAVTLAPSEVDKSDLLSVAAYVARRNRGYVLPADLQHNWEGWESESESELRQRVLDSGEYALDSMGRANPQDPSPLQHIEDYLTGNLYEKLDAENARLEQVSGKERAQVKKQISLLQERIDARRRSIDDVPIQLRVLNWMPLEWFDAYLNSDEGRKRVFYMDPRKPGDKVAKMKYEQGVYTLQWVAPPEGMKVWRRKEGTGRYGPMEQVTVKPGTVIKATPDSYDFLKYMNRLALKREKVKGVEEDIEAPFSEWLKESEYREALEDRYNRVFNAEQRREYSGDPLPIEGLREGIIPHHYQNQAVRWAAETGRGILGQDVGLGKTFIGILLAKIRRQEGRAKRPMVVVPKSVATNWAEEVESLIPGSRVLVVGEHRAKSAKAAKKAKAEAEKKGLSGEAFDKYVEENSWITKSDTDVERNRKLAMVKQNEYDLVICTKPAFDRIPLRKETVKKYEEEDFWYQRAGQIDAIRAGSATQETMDKRIRKLEASYAQEKLAEKFKHKEDFVYWEDMKIDTLIADEAHAYKNLYSARSRHGQQPKFLGGSGQSKQARKMQHMAKFVREANPENGVYFLTATPTKNSPLEVFNMLQHIAPEAFQELGIENSEQFIDRFCKMESRLVLTPPGRGDKKRKPNDDDEDETQFRDEFAGAGNLDEALCVTGFTNLKELEAIMDKYMMIQTATDVGLKIPDANQKMHTVDMTDEQRVIYAQLRDEAKSVNTREDPGEMFRVLDKMKKAAQDLELYDPENYPGWYENSPKYKACVDAAYEGAQSRGGQIIFCDHNAAHDRLKAMLMEKGLKESEIGIINAQVAKDSAARQAIGNRFNRGEVKVVIGNTGTMGEGVNLQGKKHEHGTTDIHHLDQPWDPGTLHQRNGRGVRQGNRAEQVNVHTYLAKGSFDGFRHSTLQGKERWLDKLRSGADSISNDMEGQDLDEVEMLAMLSDNPDQALAMIREKKASAQSEWYAKQAKDAVASFYNWQRKNHMISKLKPGTKTRTKLEADTERLKRQLLRHELLPQEIKTHLESGDTSPVVAATFMQGEAENARFAAKILRPGDVVKDEYSKLIISKVNLETKKVEVRHWGRAHNSEIAPDKLSSTYQVTDLTEADELKAALKNSLEHQYNGDPMSKVRQITEATLQKHSDTIAQAMKEYASKFNQEMPVFTRTRTGIEVVPILELGDRKVAFPWGRDKEAIVQAMLSASPRVDMWSEYGNKIIEAGKDSYGYTYYDRGPFKEAIDEAKRRWEKKHKKEEAA